MTIREAFGIVLLAVVIQLGIGLFFYGPFKPAPSLGFSEIMVAIGMMASVAGGIAAILVFLFKRYASERTMRVALMTLTGDERKLFEAVLRTGDKGAQQDKLRRELDMSKSKLSALVKNLERKHAITKERYFRTNILRVNKEFTGS